VRFLGDFRDQRKLHAAADFSLNLSDSEGMSNSVLESMSFGVPVVATAVGGNLEVIRDGVDGALVSRAGVAAETAGALASLFADPGRRLALGRAARARVREEFSIDRMVDRYVALYREVAGAESSGASPEPGGAESGSGGSEATGREGERA
jgi:glycosyltransferase involved in cell wall biosynthesis